MFTVFNALDVGVMLVVKEANKTFHWVKDAGVLVLLSTRLVRIKTNKKI